LGCPTFKKPKHLDNLLNFNLSVKPRAKNTMTLYQDSNATKYRLFIVLNASKSLSLVVVKLDWIAIVISQDPTVPAGCLVVTKEWKEAPSIR